jgi:transmembrane sensor
MSSAARHVAPDWSPERARVVQERLGRAIVRRKRRQVVMTAASALVFIVVALLVWSRGVGPNRSPAALAGHAVTQPLLHFEDGSTVTAASGDARAEPIEVTPELASTRLTAGAARFSVTPNPTRQFRVIARDVTVTVLGTIFTVAIEPNHVRVHVERGRVRVAWPAGEHVLTVGEELAVPSGADALTAPLAPAHDALGNAAPPEGVVPAAPGSAIGSAAHEAPPEAVAGATPGSASSAAPDVVALPAERHGAETAMVPSSHHAVDHAAPSPAPSWRVLAEDGDYTAAYAEMSHAGPSAVEDEPGDLLLAADVARLGGHPETAVAPLYKVITAHAGDSRAPLAAFTLGRTLLDQLGRPREAAQAFATARRSDPRGALAQDALAREVESWSRAGEATLAHDRAVEYTARYPKGRRLAAVKRLGGLE